MRQTHLKHVRLKHRTSPLRNGAPRGVPLSKRARGNKSDPRLPFMPPEDWHEPSETQHGYKTVIQAPGVGYRHVLTPEEIHDRLEKLPASFSEVLDVIQLSRMTRKKSCFPCYGMQWGSSIYLYPIEESLTELYPTAPMPLQRTEARMYGGRWKSDGKRGWRLIWTESAIRDYYLNNILIHELGHLLDSRNSRAVDRERFAEWFAIHWGYLPSRGEFRSGPTRVRRRHHA
jgi:hypothetical protein